MIDNQIYSKKKQFIFNESFKYGQLIVNAKNFVGSFYIDK